MDLAQVRLSSKSDLIQCQAIKDLGRCSIFQPDDIMCSLSPQKFQQSTHMEQCSDTLHDGPVQLLSNTIMLGCVVHCQALCCALPFQIQDELVA